MNKPSFDCDHRKPRFCRACLHPTVDVLCNWYNIKEKRRKNMEQKKRGGEGGGGGIYK